MKSNKKGKMNSSVPYSCNTQFENFKGETKDCCYFFNGSLNHTTNAINENGCLNLFAIMFQW